MVRVVAALVTATLLVGACSKDERATLVLDGSTRRPDAEGVVDQVSSSHLTLEGKRYPLSSKLQAFSTYTLEAVPVLARRHQYVQVGLDDGTIVWLAAFGAVVRVPGSEPTVYYTGVFRRMEGGRAVFRDGSALRLAGGTAAPKPGTRVRADIDPERHEVRALTAT